MEGSSLDMPDLFIDLLDHVVGWEGAASEWKDGILDRTQPPTKFPVEINKEVENICKALLEKRRLRLRGVRQRLRDGFLNFVFAAAE